MFKREWRVIDGVARGATITQQVRQYVLDFIRSRPGLRIEQIAQLLHIQTVDISYPIRELVNEGSLRVEGSGRGRKYFVVRPSAEEEEATVAEHDPELADDTEEDGVGDKVLVEKALRAAERDGKRSTTARRARYVWLRDRIRHLLTEGLPFSHDLVCNEMRALFGVGLGFEAYRPIVDQAMRYVDKTRREPAPEPLPQLPLQLQPLQLQPPPSAPRPAKPNGANANGIQGKISEIVALAFEEIPTLRTLNVYKTEDGKTRVKYTVTDVKMVEKQVTSSGTLDLDLN